MVGIVCISHGLMAEGMVDSAKLFYGDEVSQLTSVTLNGDDDPESFYKRLTEAIDQVNSGEGVIVFADLLGGTPANKSVYALDEKIDVITGMNLTMLIELLGLRSQGVINVDDLISVGQQGMVHLNKLFKSKK